MQNPVDLDSRDSGALQRRQQNAPERIAERQAKAALQRFSHHGGAAGDIRTRLDMELVWFNQFLPVALNHETDLMLEAAKVPLCLAKMRERTRVGRPAR